MKKNFFFSFYSVIDIFKKKSNVFGCDSCGHYADYGSGNNVVKKSWNYYYMDIEENFSVNLSKTGSKCSHQLHCHLTKLTLNC